MCERIAGIRIEGGYFGELCTLTPFALTSPQGKPRYFSIIYGKNGSGKTSLAQAFYNVATDGNIFTKAELIDHNGTAINDIDKDRIFVFDENYIRNTIGFTDDGLDSVVMLGEQVELDDKIKALELRIDALEKEIEAETTTFVASYEKATSPLAPEYHKNAIRESLRQNWAVREGNIKGMRQNAPVRDEFISSLFHDDESATLDGIRSEFEKALLQLKSAQSGERIDDKLVKVNENTNIEIEIISLLEEKIDEPTLSDKERLIMQIIKEKPENEQLVIKAKSVFSESVTKICPFCLQGVDEDYKKHIVDSISNILDTDEANQHKDSLSAIKISPLQIDLRRFRVIDNSLCDNIQEQLDEYNECVDFVQEKISQKLNSIYSPLSYEPFCLYDLQISINKNIELLAQAQTTYNNNIDSISELKSNLLTLNKSYAREEVRHLYTQLQNQIAERDSKKLSLSTKTVERERIKQSIESLNAQKKNIHIAIEIINNYLSYIFFDRNRLQLELNEGKYVVKCRRKHIRLQSLSVGERNVIALCYFLSVLFQGKSKQDIYTDKCLLVIDDPISSFDFDNKIGMYSFLRYVFDKIYEGNKNSRCLILTHELEATFSLMRIFSDIRVNCKAYELREKILTPFDDKKYNEYSFMLRQIFSYANEVDGYIGYSESIGNIMRRALEAYGTFTYKKGIEALSNDRDILNTIADTRKQDYFKNLMYRLVLHGESHLQERAQGIPDTDFFTYISDAEKIRTAKEILIFLNLLNPLHLREHLKTNPSDDVAEILNQIHAWENEIFSAHE